MGKANFVIGSKNSILVENEVGIEKFLDSPQNRTGILIWVGTMITALIQRFEFHQILSSIDLFGLILGFLKIVEPENTATLAQLQKSVTDLKVLFVTPDAESLGSVVSDVVGFVKAIER